jgi:hypothetical protein
MLVLMPRWVFQFREGERRELSEEELGRVRARLSRTLLKKWLWAGFALVSALAGMLGIILAADNRAWGWGLAIVGVVAMFFGMDQGSKNERFSLLLRRALRLKNVTRFERWAAPEEIRKRYEAVPLTEDDEERLHKIWWENDERFEELLAAYLQRPPNCIDLLDQDAVLLTVEGKIVGKVHELDTLEERLGA